MDKLPCSTSFLMSVNFDGLKEVIDFFHKNLNLLNEKINELSRKFNGLEEIKVQVNENKTKTESALRLLGEMDERINNVTQNILKNTEKSNSNEQKISKLSEEIDRMLITLNSNNTSDEKGSNDLLNRLYDNYKEIKEKIDRENNTNMDNYIALNKKVDRLDEIINHLNTKTDTNNNINENKNINQNISHTDDIKYDNQKALEEDNIKSERKSEVDNAILYEALKRRIDNLERNVSKLSNKDDAKDIITPSNTNKVTVYKEMASTDKGNDILDINDKYPDLEEAINKKLNDFSEKIKKIEKEINNIQSNNKTNVNINIPLTDIPQTTNENDVNKDINEKKDENIDENKQKENEEEPKTNEEQKEEDTTKDKDINKQIKELMAQIDLINQKLSTDESLKKADFNKYSQKIDIQLKDYNDKINKILQKDNLRNKLFEDMAKNNDRNQRRDYSNMADNSNADNKKYVTYDVLDSFEEKNRELILKYLGNLDLSSNPSILDINKNLELSKKTIKDLTSTIDEIIVKNNKDKEYNYGIMDNLKKEAKNNTKKIDKEVERISLLQEDIDFFRVFLLGQEEEIKYKRMTKEEKKNELLIGTSIKEEITIHGNYLKKLSEGINKVNTRINNLNKETLVLIKKDLKNESNAILEDFKSGLKDSISRIETQLKDKVDKLGLDEFWNKINEQLVLEMKEKIDKKEMNKNNQYFKRKIDNLESKISRTLVDTLIDLQMDEAPLVVKRNFREITGQKCASCGQNLPNAINSGIMSNSTDFNNNLINQYTKSFKFRTVGDKDKLPDIKQTLPK